MSQLGDDVLMAAAPEVGALPAGFRAPLAFDPGLALDELRVPALYDGPRPGAARVTEVL